MQPSNALQQLLNAPYLVTDKGDATTIVTDRQFAVVPIVSATTETRTLDRPLRIGQYLLLMGDTLAGAVTITVTGGVNDSASTSLVLSATGQYALLQSQKTGTTYSWKAVSVNCGSASLLAGFGTSAAPATTATANKNFREFRTKTTATSGTCRGLYLRHEFGGAGTGDGEAIRAFSTLSAAVATARGGQVSLNVSATGYVSGLGSGLEGQLYVQGIVPAGGTYYGMKAEMYFGASATIAAATEHAILAVQANGNATAVATCLNAIAFAGAADSGGGSMISPGTSMGTVTGTIRVLVNGAVRYIPYYSHEGHA